MAVGFAVMRSKVQSVWERADVAARINPANPQGSDKMMMQQQQPGVLGTGSNQNGTQPGRLPSVCKRTDSATAGVEAGAKSSIAA